MMADCGDTTCKEEAASRALAPTPAGQLLGPTPGQGCDEDSHWPPFFRRPAPLTLSRHPGVAAAECSAPHTTQVWGKPLGHTAAGHLPALYAKHTPLAGGAAGGAGGGGGTEATVARSPRVLRLFAGGAALPKGCVTGWVTGGAAAAATGVISEAPRGMYPSRASTTAVGRGAAAGFTTWRSHHHCLRPSSPHALATKMIDQSCPGGHSMAIRGHCSNRIASSAREMTPHRVG